MRHCGRKDATSVGAGGTHIAVNIRRSSSFQFLRNWSMGWISPSLTARYLADIIATETRGPPSRTDDKAPAESRADLGSTMSVRTLRCLGLSALLVATLVMLHGSASAETPACNDEITGATTIPALPYVNNQDDSQATASPSDPPKCWNGSSLWYQLTAPSTGIIRFTVNGNEPGLYTAVAVYRGSPAALDPVRCAVYDEQAEFVSPTVDISVNGTQHLYVMVGAVHAPEEAITLSARYVTHRPTLTVTSNATGTVTGAGVATLGGTLTCDDATTRPSHPPSRRPRID
jgi:hypothetical protein